MKAKKIDKNHGEIVNALRKAGATVQSLAGVGDGCPDLLVGYRGVNYLIEVKDGSKIPSKQKLTADQIKWHLLWGGMVKIAKNVEEAFEIIGIPKGIKNDLPVTWC